MDKYTYSLKSDKLLKLVRQGDYATAAKIADTLEWDQEKNFRLLSAGAEAYEKMNRINEAIDLLLRAYEYSAVGKRVLYKLTELAIRSKNITDAETFYKKYLEEAAEDNNRYVLRYMIAEAKREPLERQIIILETYRKYEFEEKWAYKLAELYYKADRRKDCVALCDEIILWFGVGTYVDKAMDLKELYEPLTADQRDHRDNRPYYENRVRQVANEMKEATDRKVTGGPSRRHVVEEPAEETPTVAAPAGVAPLTEQERMETEERLANHTAGVDISVIQEEVERESKIAHLKSVISAARNNKAEMNTIFVSMDKKIEEEEPEVVVVEEESEAEPEVVVVEEEPEAEPEVVVVEEEPEAEPKVVVAEEESEAEPEVVVAEEEPEAEPEVVVAEEESEAEPEVVVAEEEPEAEPEVVVAEEELEAEPEPEVAEENQITEADLEIFLELEDDLSTTKNLKDIAEITGNHRVMIPETEEPTKEIVIPREMIEKRIHLEEEETVDIAVLEEEMENEPEEIPVEVPAAEETVEVKVEAPEVPVYQHEHCLFLNIAGDANTIDQAVDAMEAYYDAKEQDMPAISKILAEKLNRLGLIHSLPQLKGKDLIVEQAGKLSDIIIREMLEVLEYLDTDKLFVLCDNAMAIRELKQRMLSLSEADTKVDEAEEELPQIHLSSVEELIADPEKEKDELDLNIDLGNHEPETEAPVEGEKSFKNIKANQTLSESDFIRYAEYFAHELECVLDDSAYAALEEEMGEIRRNGDPLTAGDVEDLVEGAAENAEKTRRMFAAKYNKEGFLILRKKNF